MKSVRQKFLIFRALLPAAPALADSERHYKPSPAWAELAPLFIKPASAGAAAIEQVLLDIQIGLIPKAPSPKRGRLKPSR